VIEIVSKMMIFLQKDPQLLRDLELYAIMDSNRELATHKAKAKELRA
jgi:predicted house-cleaning noncanonical NTP pyrophosphatase (MazG superfamily)